MSERESLQDLAADYALGLLGPEEAEAFEQELAQSPGLQWVVREYREALALLPLTTDVPSPAADLRARVIAQVHGGEAPSPGTPSTAEAPSPMPIHRPRHSVEVEKAAERTPGRRRTPILVWLALAASIAAAVGLGYQWRTALEKAAVHDMALQTSIDSIGRQLAAREATLRTLFAPGVELHVLKSTGAPEPGVEFFWNKKLHMALLYAFNLPAAPKGRTYQLWLMQDGKWVPSVTFDPAADGHSLVDKIAISAEIGFQSLAVTEEPTGGSPAPTTPILLLAALVS